MRRSEIQKPKIFQHGPFRGNPAFWYEHVQLCPDDSKCHRNHCGYAHPERDTHSVRWEWVFPNEWFHNVGSAPSNEKLKKAAPEPVIDTDPIDTAFSLFRDESPTIWSPLREKVLPSYSLNQSKPVLNLSLNTSPGPVVSPIPSHTVQTEPSITESVTFSTPVQNTISTPTPTITTTVEKPAHVTAAAPVVSETTAPVATVTATVNTEEATEVVHKAEPRLDKELDKNMIGSDSSNSESSRGKDRAARRRVLKAKLKAELSTGSSDDTDGGYIDPAGASLSYTLRGGRSDGSQNEKVKPEQASRASNPILAFLWSILSFFIVIFEAVREGSQACFKRLNVFFSPEAEAFSQARYARKRRHGTRHH